MRYLMFFQMTYQGQLKYFAYFTLVLDNLLEENFPFSEMILIFSFLFLSSELPRKMLFDIFSN